MRKRIIIFYLFENQAYNFALEFCKNTKMEIGEVIKRLRSGKLTQQELADRIGVNITTMNRYENEGTISNAMLEKIAAELNVTVSDIYSYKQSPSLLEEPINFYKGKQETSIDIIVRLDGGVWILLTVGFLH